MPRESLGFALAEKIYLLLVRCESSGKTVRFHRIIGFLVATAAVLLMAPTAACAQPYPAEPPPSSVSDGTVSDGGTVTFSGSGFLPFERISINVTYSGSDSTAAFRPAGGGFVLVAALPSHARLTVTADANGAFSVTVRLTEVGNATLVATGLTSGRTVTAKVKVVAPSDGDNDTTTPGDGGGDPSGSDDDTALPTTGPDGVPLLIAVAGGVGLVSFGSAILLLLRGRRRRANVDS